MVYGWYGISEIYSTMTSLALPVLNYTRCDTFLQQGAELIVQLHLKGEEKEARYISACVNEVCNEVMKLRL